MIHGEASCWSSGLASEILTSQVPSPGLASQDAVSALAASIERAWTRMVLESSSSATGTLLDENAVQEGRCF